MPGEGLARNRSEQVFVRRMLRTGRVGMANPYGRQAKRFGEYSVRHSPSISVCNERLRKVIRTVVFHSDLSSLRFLTAQRRRTLGVCRGFFSHGPSGPSRRSTSSSEFVSTRWITSSCMGRLDVHFFLQRCAATRQACTNLTSGRRIFPTYSPCRTRAPAPTAKIARLRSATSRRTMILMRRARI
ncbi:hypothetical protein AWB75_06508 [Caballeronia catudaia]|uniref:Uncharacterized protein n=1 Tax=Caballeronia catudaia TaxID=1777136 RepID=A0A158DCX8_9BURK|nr:hypothetical protein AWB75_06508 [Caballeronia catudaia]